MIEKDRIMKLKGNDTESLQELIQDYYKKIYSFVYRHVPEYHLAKDLTQEIFIKVISSLNKYKDQGSFDSWIFTIAYNHIKNHWKSNRIMLFELDMNLADSKKNQMEGIEEKELLKTAMGKLPSDQKSVIILKYYHDKTIEEISRITKSNISTTKSRLKYGLKKLNQIIAGGEDFE